MTPNKPALILLTLGICLLLAVPAMAADTIKIGALYNLTGGMSSIDAPALNGAKLQAKLINDKGGLLGKQIEIIGIEVPHPVDVALEPPAAGSIGKRPGDRGNDIEHRAFGRNAQRYVGRVSQGNVVVVAGANAEGPGPA